MRLGLAAAAIAGIALSGCVGGGEPAGNARRGGVIRIAYGAPPDSLDPALASSPAAQEALWLVYTPPLTYRRGSTELVPGLAEAMPKVSDEGRTYSFNFRKGLRYSDGSALRASDFRHTLDRVRSLRSPGALFFRNVTGVRTNDRTRHVRLRLARPDSAFPYALATTYAGVVPARTRLRAGRPVGVGPYTIGRRRRGGGFVMRRNASFSLPGVPAGNVDAITVDVQPDAAEAARAVIDGRLDYMREPPPDALLPELRSKYKDRYGEHPTAATLAFVLDARRKPFDDLALRRAAAYAVDGREVRRLLGGRLRPGCTLLPDGVPGHQTPDQCPYGDPAGHADLERARALVEKAGAERAFVRVRLPRAGPERRLVTYWARTLRKIGLRARLVGQGRRAETWLADSSPALPHPALFFSILAADDPLLDVDLERLRLLPLETATKGDWTQLDARAVDRAYLAPFGSPTRATFLSERLDFANCNRFNPVYGNDYSSFCLR